MPNRAIYKRLIIRYLQIANQLLVDWGARIQFPFEYQVNRFDLLISGFNLGKNRDMRES